MELMIVSATRGDNSHFERSPLGHSVRRLASQGSLQVRIAFDNCRGLPEVYNQAIEDGSEDTILVFVHDDVWLDDYWFQKRIHEGLAEYDVIGVAGNTRIPDHHVGWAYKEFLGNWDHPYLSGAVAHGEYPFGIPSFYGDTPKECELLDGLLIAAKRSILRERHVRFDHNFQWHFYDLDFCRTARAVGLRLSTWPLAVTHRSGGSFGSPPWRSALELYKRKYPD